MKLTVKGVKGLEELIPETGETKPVAYVREADGSLTVTLDFPIAGAYLLLESDREPVAYVAPDHRALELPVEAAFTERPENALNLDTVQLSYDGVFYERERPVMLVKDLLLRKQFAGTIYLKYSFAIKELPASLNLAVESMPYESVTFNGQPLTFDEGWWMDRSFLRANLNGRVRVGVNELVVQLSYAQSQHVYDVLYGGGNEALRNCLSFDMEIESAYLFGDFAVEMPGNHRADVMRTDVYTGPFYVVAAKDTVNVRNVVKDGYPFFAGTMHYAFDLDWKTGDTTRLDLSDGRFRGYSAARRAAEERGVTEWSMVVLTHYHSRQGAALSRFCSEELVRTVYLPTPITEEEHAILETILNRLSAGGVEHRFYERGEALQGTYEIFVSSPAYLERSTQPIYYLSVEHAGTALTYLTQSVVESSLSDAAWESASASTYLVYGSDGPKPRAVFRIPTDGGGVRTVLTYGEELLTYLSPISKRELESGDVVWVHGAETVDLYAP
jgi:hypothetical protein